MERWAFLAARSGSTAGMPRFVPLRWKAAGLRGGRGPIGPGHAGRREKKRARPFAEKENPSQKRKKKRQKKKEIKIYKNIF